MVNETELQKLEEGKPYEFICINEEKYIGYFESHTKTFFRRKPSIIVNNGIGWGDTIELKASNIIKIIPLSYPDTKWEK